MSKKKFYVLQSDADTLPAEMKGIYTGDEFPEYKGAETITFNNKTYINGLDYQTVKSGKHVRIEECPICNRLSIIYARGVCKACAQRTLYRHRRDKTGDVMTERNIREANIAFRKGWPVNIICGLDGVRYNIDDYPYSKKEEAKIVDAVTSSIQKNGIAVAAPASNYSPQNITDTQTINTTPKTEEAPPPISEEAMLALQLADMFGG